MRSAATELRRRNHQGERRIRDRREAERRHSGGHEYLRRHHAPLVILMIDERSRAQGNRRVVPGEMRVHCLTVVVRRVLDVEMHVRQRSGDRSGLYEHDEHPSGQPAKHGAIVVKRPQAGT